MPAFDIQECLSRQLLKNSGTFIISKVTRAAATTSITKTALENGLKVLVVVPKKKIAKELSAKISQLLPKSPRTMIIGSNTDLCPKLEKLDVMFQFKKNCRKCDYEGESDRCPFQNLLLNDFDLLFLTYHKLETLFLNKDNPILTPKAHHLFRFSNFR